MIREGGNPCCNSDAISSPPRTSRLRGRSRRPLWPFRPGWALPRWRTIWAPDPTRFCIGLSSGWGGMARHAFITRWHRGSIPRTRSIWSTPASLPTSRHERQCAAGRRKPAVRPFASCTRNHTYPRYSQFSPAQQSGLNYAAKAFRQLCAPAAAGTDTLITSGVRPAARPRRSHGGVRRQPASPEGRPPTVH